MKQLLGVPQIPVSWGELIDKITILMIKKEKITAPRALSNVENELKLLSQIVLEHEGVAKLIETQQAQLLDVNQRLWQVEDDIRQKDLMGDFDSNFINLAKMVYRLNDERSLVKKSINEVLNSALSEEKSYAHFQSK